MQKILAVTHINELDNAAKTLLDVCKSEKKFAFYGEMGSGKTTFIKAICHQLGIKDNMSSPTFSIINEYSNDEPVYHMDFFRLRNLQEAIDIGVEEYLANAHYCFIEWPEIAENILPPATVRVYIRTKDQETRIIKIDK